MQKRPLKITLIMLFLLTFISQAMASSLMSYKMLSHKMIEKDASFQSNDEHHHNNASATNTSLTHDHVIYPSNNAQLSDDTQSHQQKCCSKNKMCMIIGCSVVSLTIDISIPKLTAASAVKYTAYRMLVISQQPKSLYRPPILS